MDGKIQKQRKYLSIEDFLNKNKEKVTKIFLIIVSSISLVGVLIGLICTSILKDKGITPNVNEYLGTFSLKLIKENYKNLTYKIVDEIKNENIILEIDVSNGNDMYFLYEVNQSKCEIYFDGNNYINEGFDIGDLNPKDFVYRSYDNIITSLYFALRNIDISTSQSAYIENDNFYLIENDSSNYQIYNRYGLLIEGKIDGKYSLESNL